MPNDSENVNVVELPAPSNLAPALTIHIRVREVDQPATRCAWLRRQLLRALSRLTKPGRPRVEIFAQFLAGDKLLSDFHAWRPLGEEAVAVLPGHGGCAWHQGFLAGRLEGRHEVLHPPTAARLN